MIDRPPRSRRAVRLALMLALGSIGSPSAPGADEPHRVAWRTDLAEAQSEARSRDLLLWIQFTGPWCINCRRMERGAFAHAGVVEESRSRFIPVKLRSDEHEALALTLGLSSLPATVIVRPSGEVVDKIEGYSDPEAFTGFLRTALDRTGRTHREPGQRPGAGGPSDPDIALAGYCPVTLIRERKLVAGRDDLSAQHDGQRFRFASEAQRAEFLRHPGVFTPANGGRCPVSQVDRGEFSAGDPKWGIVYAGHLFLFRDAAIRDRFAKDPERYAPVDVTRRETCPHCRGVSRLVAGKPARFSSSTFDDSPAVVRATHLEALLVPDMVRR